MMAAKKNNSKSVRLSDEVLSYIENYEGDGFNQKFENIILYSMKTESDREQRIQWLNDQIAEKRSILDQIRKYEQILTSVGFRLRQLDTDVSHLFDD